MDNDYLLLDLPYHCNLGDTLIWQGEKDYLSTLPYRCLYRTSCGGNVAKAFKKISKETIILLHGRGNFGDLWPLHNAFRKKAHEMFPHQKTIILPQSVYYKSQGKLEEDADFYMRYPNVTICARDRVSFEILTQYFPNNPKLLVPDMAFCMEMNSYRHIANLQCLIEALFTSMTHIYQYPQAIHLLDDLLAKLAHTVMSVLSLRGRIADIVITIMA